MFLGNGQFLCEGQELCDLGGTGFGFFWKVPLTGQGWFQAHLAIKLKEDALNPALPSK